VASPEELADALAAGRVAGLPGMGARTEANLRRALERMAQRGDGIPLALALPLAETLRDRLTGVAEVERVEVAGSLRRMKATVHDLDLLAASTDPAVVNRAFTELPQVAEVAALGDTKASVRTRDGRLGMAWVPPVLREDRGEVDAARRGELPKLVTLEDVGGDFHCHTDLSPDGTAPLEVMVEAARARGYRFLSITDHGERLGLGGASRDQLLAQRARIRALEARLGDITLLHGAELNIGGDGTLDYDDEFLDGFDVLVASVHDRLDQPREQLTARLIAACEHPAVNVIGHPTGRRIGSRAAGDVDLEALYRAAARTGTALEVNGSPHRLDLGDEQVRLAHQFGVMFSFGSDSHGPGHLANMRFAVATAGRGWTTPDRVINTLPMGELRRFLAKGRPGR
jgi:DNA polymerase (family 10)